MSSNSEMLRKRIAPPESATSQDLAPPGQTSSAHYSSLVVVALAGLPGYFGVFGLAHAYLGQWFKGVLFFLLGIATIGMSAILVIQDLGSEKLRALAVAFSMLAVLLQTGDALALTHDRVEPVRPPQLGQITAAALTLVPLPAAIESLYWLRPSASKFTDDLIYSSANWLALFVIVLLLRRRSNPREALGWSSWSTIDLLWALSGVFFVRFPLKMLGVAATQLFALQPRPLNHAHGPGFGDLFVGLICDVLTPAVAEETLYRGFLINYFRARECSAFVAAVVSMLIFSAIHVPNQGFYGALVILVWSVVPTFLFLWRGSVLPGVIVHLYSDSIAFLRL